MNLPNSDVSTGYPYKFMLLYTLLYMGNAVYFTFIAIYLDNVGFGKTAIGLSLIHISEPTRPY